MRRRLLILAVVLVGLGACKGSDPAVTSDRYDAPVSSGESLADWAGTNASVLHGISAALDAVSTSAQDYDLNGMGVACGRLSLLAGQLSDALPSPDPDTTYDLTQAVEHYQRAADLCISGANAFDADLIGQSAAEIDQATEWISRATDDLGS